MIKEMVSQTASPMDIFIENESRQVLQALDPNLGGGCQQR